MEHLTILGGEQYLPFARSRIKAMRANGVSYASQKFEIEGCSIRVRIEGAQEYIEIEGGGSSIMMDSGVALLVHDIAVPEEVPTISTSKLYATSYVLNYDTNFSIPAARAGWFVTPAGASQQIAGKVTYKGKTFRGQIPTDQMPPLSFSPTMKVSDDIPPLVTLQMKDGALSAKKDIAAGYPASNFTGRCRLWVQALYGRPMYGLWPINADGTPRGPGTTIPQFLKSDHRGLVIDTHVPTDAVNVPQGNLTYNINTNTGVILDMTTGKHWVATVWPTGIEFRPMFSEAAAGWRKYLIPKADGSYAYSQEDREHIEAYILSVSRPEALGAYTVPFGRTVSTNSMGYGWHWNWSGTAADIVDTQQYAIGSIGGTDYRAMESEHLRINVSQGADGKYTASLVVVAAKTRWALESRYHVISAPAGGSQHKVLPLSTIPVAFPSTAFYAFYNRDELKLCTVASTWIAPQDPVVDSQPPWFKEGPENQFRYGIGAWCIGDSGGFWMRRKEGLVQRFVTTFNICGYDTGPMERDITRDFERVTVYDRVLGGLADSHDISGPYFNLAPGHGSYYINGFLATGGIKGTFPAQFGMPSVWYWLDKRGYGFSSKLLDEYGSRTDHVVFVLVIPSNNAEAVCWRKWEFFQEVATKALYTGSNSTNGESGWVQRWTISKFLNYGDRILQQDTVEETGGLIRSGWWWTTLDTLTEDVTSPVTTESDEQKMYCAGAFRDFTFGPVDAFMDGGVEDVGTPYSILSGVAQTDPVIIVQDPISQPPIGVTTLPTDKPASPTIIGWA